MNFKADIKRYGLIGLINQPSLWAILIYRFGRWTILAPKFLRFPMHAAYFFLYSSIRLITGVDIPRTADVGKGFMIHHFSGVIIHPQAKIGENCTLRHGVTIGARHDGGSPPRIGDNFTAGAYAQILGEISIGNDVQVGALSLMITNGEDSAVYAGIPAKKIN